MYLMDLQKYFLQLICSKGNEKLLEIFGKAFDFCLNFESKNTPPPNL